MNKLKTILFTLLALMTTMVMAQQARTLTGVVVDDFNEPIPGANIVVSNQQNRALKGTVTDIDGNFVLTMPPGEKFNIQISYIGMKTQRIEYKGQTTLKVKMSEDSRMLAGAEVTAQRVERSELGVSFREQTSATQKISMVEITEKLQNRFVNVGYSGGEKKKNEIFQMAMLEPSRRYSYLDKFWR